MNRLVCSTLAILLGTIGQFQSLHAASTVTTMHGPNPNFDHTLFDGMLSNTDLIQGMIATELPGDRGWHPANTNPANQLSAFTDGLGGTGDFTGLLNDFPGDGVPTKLIQYDFSSAVSIGQINILTGNRTNVDGRAFCTVVIKYSTDNGANYSPLGGFVPGIGTNASGYYQSDVPLAINAPGGSAQGNLETLVTFMSITDDGSPLLASGVTNLQFDFYATNNTVNWYWDPFDGVNPFTGFDDQQSEAISSPLVWEIDVIEGPSVSADFDEDGDVDGRDFLIWQRGHGIDDGTAMLADGDATGDGNVDGADLQIWQGTYGLGPLASVTAVPEPSTIVVGSIVWLMTWGCLRSKRRD